MVLQDSEGAFWACGLSGTLKKLNPKQAPAPEHFDDFAKYATWQDSLIPTRHVTSRHFSPDHEWVGYTVSNFLLPEDDLYVMRLSDHKCFHLPVLTSRAAWAWGQ